MLNAKTKCLSLLQPSGGTSRIDQHKSAAPLLHSNAKSSQTDASKEEKEKVASKIRESLLEWSQTAECSEGSSKEFPPSLTAYERLIVHQWAEEHGYQHRSIGDNHDRRIVVQKAVVPVTRFVDEEVEPLIGGIDNISVDPAQKEDEHAALEDITELKAYFVLTSCGTFSLTLSDISYSI